VSNLEIGYFANTALRMLEQALQEVYLPLISNAEFEAEEFKRSPNDKENSEKEHKSKSIQAAGKFVNLKSDMVLTVQRFTSQISHIVQQVAGETRLKIPEELAELATMEVGVAKEDREIVHKLEVLAEEWIEIVSGALGKEAKNIPKGNVYKTYSGTSC
jgi:dynein heavy chain, axonemal